ncbi:antitoxin VapB family protein [Candidatus Woesearchaeota archaeon]|nr:antitoxin VapB family protein [Candidatus Woesearchaeota archaeon]
MAVKTITIKESAYEALKSLKFARESFSDTILRVARRKPLSAFFGALSKKTGERLEREVFGARKKRNQAHRARVNQIAKTFNEM